MHLLPRRRGLTLIEITVALAIAVLLFSAVALGVGALTGTRAKEASAELAGTIRALYDTAALSGKTCRLVFELPSPKAEDGAVSWRAQCAKGNITTSGKRDDELRAAGRREERRRDRRFVPLDSAEGPTVQELQAREQERVEDLAAYSDFSSDDVAARTLPGAVRVEVWTAKQTQVAKSGPAFLYFFPQGFTERSQIWVRQGDNTWTLTVSPLTGKVAIASEDLEVPRQ